MKHEVAQKVASYLDQDTISSYIEDRIQTIYKQMEWDYEGIREIQGAIKELRKLQDAKITAQNILKAR